MEQEFNIIEIRDGRKLIKRYVIPSTGEVVSEEIIYLPPELIPVIEEMTQEPESISFLLGENSEILGMSLSDMTGNTGWVVLDASTIDYRAINALTDQHGIPLYKLINNQIVEVPEEERQEQWPVEVERLTDDDIVDILADQEYRLCLLELGIEEDELYDV